MDQSPAIKKSFFVTFVAIVAIVISAWALLSNVIGLVSFSALSNDPTFNQARQFADSNAPHWLFQLFVRWFIPLMIVEIVFFALSLVASIGLYQRKEWSRKVFLALVGIATLSQIVMVIAGLFVMNSTIQSMGQTYLIDKFMPSAGISVAFWIVILLAIAIALVWKLNNKETRLEFTRPLAG